jgi:hypothetical protein
MDRREALALTVTLLGTTIVGSQVFLGACSAPEKANTLLTEADIPLLNAISDMIFPKSESSPGAGDAHVGKFIQAIVSECYSVEQETDFVSGLREMEKKIQGQFGMPFTALAPADQHAILAEYDVEARAYEAEDKPHFYNRIFQLTTWGYFISEPGATKALRYNPVPGRFDGCVPYHEGDKAWV